MIESWKSIRRRLPFKPRVIRKCYSNGFYVDLIDFYECFWRNGWYEHSEIETQDWIIDHLQEDAVVFDVGAHIGYYSMLFSSCAPKGHVYAFEASPEACEKFRLNVEYNVRAHHRNFQNIELIHTAVGDQVADGQQETLYFSGKPNDGKVQSKFNFITLDSFCRSRNLTRLDLIKSDVDSWDYEVLLGARWLIKRFRPVILAEVNYALGWRNHSEIEVKRFLKEVSYDYQVLDFSSSNNWLMFPEEEKQS